MALTEHSIHSGCFSNGFYVHILAVIVVLGLYLWTLMGFFRPGEPVDLARCRHVCMCMYECMYVCMCVFVSFQRLCYANRARNFLQGMGSLVKRRHA